MRRSKKQKTLLPYEIHVPITGTVIYEVMASSEAEARRIIAHDGGEITSKFWEEDKRVDKIKAYQIDPFYDVYAGLFGTKAEGF